MTNNNPIDPIASDLLLDAVRKGAGPTLVQTLIDAGADVNAQYVQSDELDYLGSWITRLPESVLESLKHLYVGGTPLHAAARYGAGPDVVQVLLNAGADVNAQDKDGETPLHLIGGSDDAGPAVVRALVAAGADVKERDKHGRTPLHRAVGNGAGPAVVQALIDAGANVNARNEDGETPLSLYKAETKDKDDADPAVVQVLIDAGAEE